MKAALWRFLLAPLTSLRALRIRRLSRDPFDFDSAWRQARMHRAPDEFEFLLRRCEQDAEARRSDAQHDRPSSGSADRLR
ncbi:hypothetical protein [Kitasatospora phosalacinea]|uniref:Uncharacterized protein n=1 Tax=Kitasatospora phosalacinea TaxID=2065 RepID=A0A9W6PR00_9ACTN|nr:hypothetical protein [Kitasatospora phosalacinea]GLW59378.1 hypothetical protein Kpho01_73880 [Kitasatospora phosalacinea]